VFAYPYAGNESLKIVKLTSVKVDGKKAALMASAKMDDQAMAGSIDMEEEGGQWKVGKGSWEPAKK
jgi:hypothetical protein